MVISPKFFWLGQKAKFFLWKKQQNNGNLGQGNESAENGSAKNTPNTPKFIRPIFSIGPQLWDMFEKGASLDVRGP